jgi:hydrogenase nickel incorporation protein HypB
MCKDCGCEKAVPLDLFQTPSFSFLESPQKERKRRIQVEKDILAKNNEIAEQNHRWFQKHKIKVLNIMSSPGSGKTLLLEKTLPLLSEKYKVAVLVGDQRTENDALRLRGKGALVKQLNTNACHLDATMIANERGNFIDESLDFLIIENVGNLVCPASFYLGEDLKIAFISVCEGEDKPAKYPILFYQADLVVLTKIDLLPFLEWDRSLFESSLFLLNPKVPVLSLSAKTGENLQEWIHYFDTLQENLCV